MPCQHVTDLLEGRTPSRLPWVPELNGGFVRRVLGKSAPRAGGPVDEEESYWRMEAACARKIGADVMHRVDTVRTVRSKVTIERDASGATVIHTPAGDLRQRQTWEPDSGTVFTREHLIKGVESFAAYRAYVEDETYEPIYEAAAEELAASDLPTIEAPASPLMHLVMWIMDAQPALMAMMDHPGEMAELMAAMHAKNKEWYRLAAAGPGRIVRPMEDTSMMLTGPKMYAEHCVAHLNEYAAIVHAGGKLFVPHMCGHLGGMLDVIAEIDLDGIEAITPPPLGNADLADMRRRLGDIWLIGGVAPSMYATAAPEAFAAHVRGALQTMRGDRKFMLGHEEIPLAAKMENVRIAARLAADTAGWFYR